MRTVAALSLSLVLVALPAGPASAGWLWKHHAEPCCFDDGPVYLRAELTQRTHTVEVPFKPGPVAKTQVKEEDVPVACPAPACAIDPHTGCPVPACQPVTKTEKVKHAVIEVVPPEKCTDTRKEQRVENCITIFIQRLPCAAPPPCPPPCPPAAGH
jgi:hypothetical protein